MRVKIKLQGIERWAEIDVEGTCLKLEVPEFPLEVLVDRRVIRETMNTLGYNVDRNMWWDGYDEALADVLRFAEAELGGDEYTLQEWVTKVRQKFGLESKPITREGN